MEPDAAPGGVPSDRTRFEAVIAAAERCGLLRERRSRIAGRVSPRLIEQAKRQTGIESDSDLITFALSSVALEDDFVEWFRKAGGTVATDLKLGY